MMKRENLARPFGQIAVGIGLTVLVFVGLWIGCGSRKEAEDDDTLAKANAAIATAEAAMAQAGFPVTLDSVSENTQALLPSVEKLSTVETQAYVEVAIDEFYSVLDVYDVALDPLELLPLERPNPAAPQAGAELSTRDEALIHLFLGYLYFLDALSRLARQGGNIFAVEAPRDLATGRVYLFRLLFDIQDLTPDEVLDRFTPQQRQAVVDALAILTGGEFDARGQTPSLNANRFRRSALFHILEAIRLAAAERPEIRNAISRLQTAVRDRILAEDLLVNAERWGFTIEKLPPELIALVR